MPGVEGRPSSGVSGEFLPPSTPATKKSEESNSPSSASIHASRKPPKPDTSDKVKSGGFLARVANLFSKSRTPKTTRQTSSTSSLTHKTMQVSQTRLRPAAAPSGEIKVRGWATGRIDAANKALQDYQKLFKGQSFPTLQQLEKFIHTHQKSYDSYYSGNNAGTAQGEDALNLLADKKTAQQLGDNELHQTILNAAEHLRSTMLDEESIPPLTREQSIEAAQYLKSEIEALEKEAEKGELRPYQIRGRAVGLREHIQSLMSEQRDLFESEPPGSRAAFDSISDQQHLNSLGDDAIAHTLYTAAGHALDRTLNIMIFQDARLVEESLLNSYATIINSPSASPYENLSQLMDHQSKVSLLATNYGDKIPGLKERLSERYEGLQTYISDTINYVADRADQIETAIKEGHVTSEIVNEARELKASMAEIDERHPGRFAGLEKQRFDSIIASTDAFAQAQAPLQSKADTFTQSVLKGTVPVHQLYQQGVALRKEIDDLRNSPAAGASGALNEAIDLYHQVQYDLTTITRKLLSASQDITHMTLNDAKALAADLEHAKDEFPEAGISDSHIADLKAQIEVKAAKTQVSYQIRELRDTETRYKKGIDVLYKKKFNINDVKDSALGHLASMATTPEDAAALREFQGALEQHGPLSENLAKALAKAADTTYEESVEKLQDAYREMERYASSLPQCIVGWEKFPAIMQRIQDAKPNELHTLQRAFRRSAERDIGMYDATFATMAVMPMQRFPRHSDLLTALAGSSKMVGSAPQREALEALQVRAKQQASEINAAVKRITG